MACAASSPALALDRGQQWFVDNGLQIMGLIGDPSRGVPFSLSTYQSMGYTTQLWEWHTDPAQLTTSWGRWVSSPSDMPPQGAESSHMGTLKHLGLGDEEDLNTASVRDTWVAWYNSAHANSTYNGVLLWNNNWGGQINDTALGDFISRAHPDMISFDAYPYAPGSQPGGGSPTNWYGSFRQYRQWGMDTDTPVGFYRQTYTSPSGSPQTRPVSQSELSLQTFAGLAFNAKSIEDFTYNHSGTTLFDGGSGDTTLTPLGVASKVMNAEAKRLGPALVKLKPVADQTTPNYTSSMMFIRGKNTNASTYNAAPNSFVVDPQNNAYTDWVQGRNDPYMLEPTTATNLGTKNNGLPGDVIVSWFRVMDETMDGSWANEKYFMVVNGLADMNATEAETRQSLNLDFDFGASGITQLQRVNRSTGLVEDVNLTPLGGSNYRLSLTLDGGRGDLFKFKDGAPFVGVESATTATLYWDNDGSSSGNSAVNGTNLGGTGTWDGSARWYNGTSDIAWAANSNAIFWGAAGTVTLSGSPALNSLQFKSDGYQLTGSTLTMMGSSITVDSAVTATISSAVAGSAGLVKGGSGTLNLATANSYTGGTIINAGVLGIVSTSLGPNPGSPAVNLTINNGATLRFNANASLTANRQVALGSGGGVIDTNGNTATIAGLISGSSLTKAGAGTLVLSNTANAYSGGTTINGGTLTMGGADERVLGAQPGSFTDNIFLNSGTLQWGMNGDLNQLRRIVVGAGGGAVDTNGFQLTGSTGSGQVTGTGTFTKKGAGTFLDGNTISVPRIVIAGPSNSVYQIVNSGQLPQPATDVADALTLDGGTLRLFAQSWTSNIHCGLTVTANGGFIDNNESGTGIGGHTNTFNLTWAGAITGDSAGTLNKVSGGVLRITGVNTFNGTVNVAGGILELAGGSAIGDGSAVTLANVSGVTMNLLNSETIGSLSGGGGNGGFVSLNALTLTAGGDNTSTTFSGGINGSGNLTKIGAGTMTLTGPNIYSGTTTVSGGKLLLRNTMTSSPSVSVQTGATLELAAASSVVLKTSTLALSGTAKVNLQDRKMIVKSTPIGSWNGAAYTDLTGMIQSGRNSGAWNGSGIMTSMTAAASPNFLTTLAIATAGDVSKTTFGGMGVSVTDVLVMYTYAGDANLSGAIDGDDYFRIDNGYAAHANGWSSGDFDYNGRIDADDYFLIDRNYARRGSAFSGAALPSSSGVSVVPEPGSIGLMLAAGVLARRRSRR